MIKRKLKVRLSVAGESEQTWEVQSVDEAFDVLYKDGQEFVERFVCGDLERRMFTLVISNNGDDEFVMSLNSENGERRKDGEKL